MSCNLWVATLTLIYELKLPINKNNIFLTSYIYNQRTLGPLKLMKPLPFFNIPLIFSWKGQLILGVVHPSKNFVNLLKYFLWFCMGDKTCNHQRLHNTCNSKSHIITIITVKLIEIGQNLLQHLTCFGRYIFWTDNLNAVKDTCGFMQPAWGFHWQSQSFQRRAYGDCLCTKGISWGKFKNPLQSNGYFVCNLTYNHWIPSSCIVFMVINLCTALFWCFKFTFHIFQIALVYKLLYIAYK